MENYTIQNLSAPRKQGILDLKENYIRLLPSPTESKQGAE